MKINNQRWAQGRGFEPGMTHTEYTNENEAKAHIKKREKEIERALSSESLWDWYCYSEYEYDEKSGKWKVGVEVREIR